MKKTLFVILLIYAFGTQAQHTYKSYVKDQTTYREHPIDITRMKLEVAFEPQKGLVKGKVTHSFTVLQQRVDSIFFDGPGIRIKSAKLGSDALSYRTTDKGIWVIPTKPLQWDQNLQIVFEYEATPRKGIYFIGWNVPGSDKPATPFSVRKQIWTQGQGIDNRYWIPMYDDMNDKFITETVITFENGYEVLSNGSFIKKTANKDNTTTWHYSMTKPHAGYLLMLGIGKYAIKKTKSKRGVPMSLYYYPEFPERAEPTYRYSEMMVDFLEEETGVLYPWESYSQIMVQDFLYGAMENTTATIFGDFFNVDERAYIDRNYVGVNCHELTHQWFGDYITARDGRDTWLQESWATYYPKQLTKKLYGNDAYNWQRRGEHQSAIEAGKKDKNPIRHTYAGTARVYPKGSAVISMLAYVLGEDQWKRALTHYLKSHPYGNVETNDLQQAIQDKLGKDLSWFFDQWVLRPGEPEFTVHYEDLTYTDGSHGTEVAIEQTHLRDEVVGLFKMPMVIQVHYTDGTVDEVTEWIDEQFEVVKLNNPLKKKIAFVLFDPNSMVIKTLKFKKGFDELKAQVLKAPHMLDRYDALVALRDVEVNKKRELLLEVFAKESFHAMKSEIINQLIQDENSVMKLTQQLPPQSKVAFIKAYQGNQKDVLNYVSLCLKDSSYDVVQAALEKLCKLDASHAANYLAEVKNVMGMNNSVAIKMHELSILNQIDVQVNQLALIEYASNRWEFRTRNNAFSAIKSAGVFMPGLIPHLFDAMLSTNSRLANPAADCASYFAQQVTYLKAMQEFMAKQNYTTEQKDILKKLMPQLF